MKFCDFSYLYLRPNSRVFREVVSQNGCTAVVILFRESVCVRNEDGASSVYIRVIMLFSSVFTFHAYRILEHLGGWTTSDSTTVVKER